MSIMTFAEPSLENHFTGIYWNNDTNNILGAFHIADLKIYGTSLLSNDVYENKFHQTHRRLREILHQRRVVTTNSTIITPRNSFVKYTQDPSS